MTNMTDRSAWSDDQWADYINAPEANPVLAIIERGRRIAEYKAVVHADKQTGFERFCKERLRISDGYARKLIRVGSEPKFGHSVTGLLPASVGTLEELTRLSEAEFVEALTAGKIHPEMTRADAEALRKPARQGTQPAAGDPPASVPPAEPAATGLPWEEDGQEKDEEPDAPPELPVNPIKTTGEVPTGESKPRAKPNSEGLCTMLFLVLCDLQETDDIDVSALREKLSLLRPDTLNKLIDVLMMLKS